MDIAQITHHPLIWAMPQREDVFFPGSFPFIPAWKTFGLYLLILATYENWRRRLVGFFKSLNWLSWFLQLVRLGHFWCQKDVVCIDHLVHDDDWSQWESWCDHPLPVLVPAGQGVNRAAPPDTPTKSIQSSVMSSRYILFTWCLKKDLKFILWIIKRTLCLYSKNKSFLHTYSLVPNNCAAQINVKVVKWSQIK